MHTDKTKTYYKAVMIIDDSIVDLYLAEQFMKKFHFSKKIISMRSAKAALEYLQSFADSPEKLPGLIFLDIKMPEIDGFGFLAEFERLPSIVTGTMTIIMLSSSKDPRDIKLAENNRFVTRFITKPINKEKLYEISTKITMTG